MKIPRGKKKVSKYFLFSFTKLFALKIFNFRKFQILRIIWLVSKLPISILQHFRIREKLWVLTLGTIEIKEPLVSVISTILKNWRFSWKNPWFYLWLSAFFSISHLRSSEFLKNCWFQFWILRVREQLVLWKLKPRNYPS